MTRTATSALHNTELPATMGREFGSIRVQIAAAARPTEVPGHEPQQDELTALLRRTPLAHLISASRTVTDRLEFVAGLRGLLFDDEHRDTFLERGQLHPLMADNCWVFGEEWNYSEEELSIGNVLKKHLGILRPEEAAGADTSRRFDLLLSNVIPEHNHETELRRLIVELKRANKRLGIDEVNQIKRYARSVVSHPQCRDERSTWDFWLVGNEIHNDVGTERHQLAGSRLAEQEGSPRRADERWVTSYPHLR